LNLGVGRKHGSPLPLLPLLLVAGACATTPPASQPATPRSAEFEDGQRLFLQRQFAAAAERFEGFLHRFPSSPHASDAAYWAGRCYLSTQQYERAENSFQQSLRRSRTPALEVAAQMGLADACFMQKDYNKAAGHYRQVWAHRSRGSVPGDLVLYRLGQCSQRGGEPARALEYFGQLRERFPDSRYLSRALPGAGRAHYVQLGLYSQRATAEGEASSLQGKGISAYVVKDGGLYAVRTGRFATLAEAEREAKRLKSRSIDAMAK